MVGHGDVVHDFPKLTRFDTGNTGHTDINGTALIGDILLGPGNEGRRTASGNGEVTKRLAKHADFFAFHVGRTVQRCILGKHDRTTIGLPPQDGRTGIRDCGIKRTTHRGILGHRLADLFFGIKDKRLIEDIDRRYITDITGQRCHTHFNRTRSHCRRDFLVLVKLCRIIDLHFDVAV